jgi:uncharacterized membrane protein YjjP (DUF1212 family)
MKSSLSQYGLGAFPSANSKRFSAWLSIIGVTLFGGYLLNKHFGLWAVVAVGISGMFGGAVVYTFAKRKKFYATFNFVFTGKRAAKLPQTGIICQETWAL